MPPLHPHASPSLPPPLTRVSQQPPLASRRLWAPPSPHLPPSPSWPLPLPHSPSPPATRRLSHLSFPRCTLFSFKISRSPPPASASPPGPAPPSATASRPPLPPRDSHGNTRPSHAGAAPSSVGAVAGPTPHPLVSPSTSSSLAPHGPRPKSRFSSALDSPPRPPHVSCSALPSSSDSSCSNPLCTRCCGPVVNSAAGTVVSGVSGVAATGGPSSPQKRKAATRQGGGQGPGLDSLSTTVAHWEDRYDAGDFESDSGEPPSMSDSTSDDDSTSSASWSAAPASRGQRGRTVAVPLPPVTRSSPTPHPLPPHTIPPITSSSPSPSPPNPPSSAPSSQSAGN